MSLLKKIFRRNKTRNGDAGAAYSTLAKEYSISDQVLGRGTFAEVRKGMRKKNGQPVAVKIIDKTGLSNKELNGLSKEVKILQRLRHKNVVKLYDWFEENDTMYVVMEYVGGGELFEHILNEDKPFNENDARKIIRTLAEGLKHCKDNGVIHRDIKPQNLLLTEGDNELKLADFNLSIQVDPEAVDFSLLETMCGTPNYVAPEILSHKPYDFKCDIWSLGVICFLLLSGGYLPFFVEENGEKGKDLLLKKVKAGKWGFYPADVWQNVSNDAKSFLLAVMNRKPEKRLDYVGVLSHAWLKTDSEIVSQPINVAPYQQSKFKRHLHSAATVILASKKLWTLSEEAPATSEFFTAGDISLQQSGMAFGMAE